MKKQRYGFISSTLILIIFGVLVFSGGAYYLINLSNEELPNGEFDKFPDGNEPVACTTEAKMCPDGSYVGRVAPDCEFAECPEAKETEKTDPTAGWKTYRNEEYGFEFEYDKNWKWATKNDDCIKMNAESGSCVLWISFFDIRAEEEGYNPQSPEEVKTEYVLPPSLIVYENTSLEDWVNDQLESNCGKECGPSIFSKTLEEKVKIALSGWGKTSSVFLSNGMEVSSLEAIGMSNGPWTSLNIIVFSFGDYVYEFRNHNNSNALDKILSTFKFID
ncbi:MAG: hypothetical protein K9M15_00925 [Candidatus Marinimicrobia bacterium]|nr:hypothetical protein [Candidatus Neomarinimicrobiota bacterium]